MKVDKEKLLYRIFKEDAKKIGLNMRNYYHKRRKGLMPFLTQNEDIVWLKRKQYHIAAVVKKKTSTKKITRSKGTNTSGKGYRRDKTSDSDVVVIDKNKLIKYVIHGIIALTTILVILGLFKLIFMY